MAILPLICTVDVENGSDVVTVSDDTVLTTANTVPGASVFIDGVAYSVHEDGRLSTTTFRISRAYAGVDDEDLPCEIAQWTQEMLSRLSISRDLRDYDARAALLGRYSGGMFYQSIGYTADGDPGAGKVSRNAPSWVDATKITFDPIDAGGHDETPRLEALEIGTLLTVRHVETGAYVSFRTTELVNAEDGFFEFDNVQVVGFDEVSGVPPDGDDLTIEPWRVGEGLFYDKHAANVAGLAPYTGTAGIKVLVSDTGSGKVGIYTRNDAASAWIGPAILEGPPGAAGATTAEVLAELGIYDITISEDDPPEDPVADNRIWIKLPPA